MDVSRSSAIAQVVAVFGTMPHKFKFEAGLFLVNAGNVASVNSSCCSSVCMFCGRRDSGYYFKGFVNMLME